MSGYTEICIRPENKVRISKNGLFSANSLIDSNRDGLVDIISHSNGFISDSLTNLGNFVGIKLSSNQSPNNLYRDKNFSSYPELFLDADKKLNDEMKRFDNLIKKYLPDY